MSEAEAQPVAKKPKLRWYQYRLRTLLLFVLAANLMFCWIAVKRDRERRLREAIGRIEQLYGQHVGWHSDFHASSGERGCIFLAGTGQSYTIVVTDQSYQVRTSKSLHHSIPRLDLSQIDGEPILTIDRVADDAHGVPGRFITNRYRLLLDEIEEIGSDNGVAANTARSQGESPLGTAGRGSKID